MLRHTLPEGGPDDLDHVGDGGSIPFDRHPCPLETEAAWRAVHAVAAGRPGADHQVAGADRGDRGHRGAAAGAPFVEAWGGGDADFDSEVGVAGGVAAKEVGVVTLGGEHVGSGRVDDGHTNPDFSRQDDVQRGPRRRAGAPPASDPLGEGSIETRAVHGQLELQVHGLHSAASADRAARCGWQRLCREDPVPAGERVQSTLARGEEESRERFAGGQRARRELR